MNSFDIYKKFFGSDIGEQIQKTAKYFSRHTGKSIKGKRLTEKEIHTSKIGRNELCPCRSGQKYKKCCIDKEKET